MKVKETYLSRDFRETAAQRFPAQAKQLNAAFDMRLNALLAENAGASKEKQYHLKRQILPGIAAYETLQRVMPKEEALQTVHGYVERLARTSHKQLATLLLIPGLYRLVPGVFVKSTRSVFGPAAGFAPKELQTGNGVWRVDMMECPYHDTCTEYGCPELCRCFCDSEQLLLSAGQGENASVRQSFNSQIGYGFRYSFVHGIPVCADVLQPEGNLGRRVGVEKLRF